MRLPGFELVAFINHQVREADEFFDDPDDDGRVRRALDRARQVAEDNTEQYPTVMAAAAYAYEIVHAQGFGEGNKRTGYLAARWILSRNGEDADRLLPADDPQIARLLVQASTGFDVLRNLYDRMVLRR